MKNNQILEANQISIQFGGVKAVNNFDLKLYPGELVGLIGPNGAGKTTIFNLLSGVYQPTSGELKINQQPYGKMNVAKLVHRGIARTFQNIRLFDHMSVLDNVLTANNFNMRYGFLQGALRTKAYWEEEKQARQEAIELLKIFNLDTFKDYKAGNLPYGEQRKLEIVRAMATRPKVLLLDEPAAGMNPKETEELMDTIKFIRDHFQIAVLLIEHDMKLVLGICERLIVLDHGEIIAQGDPHHVINDSEVIKAYLGDDEVGGVTG